jgi:hypothetical protein
MQRAFALDVLVCPRWGGSLRVLGIVEVPGAVRQILIHRAWRTFGPPLDTLQCSAPYTAQVDELTHGFFELSSTALGAVRRRLPSGLCPGQEGAPPKSWERIPPLRRTCDPLWQSWHKPCG